MCSYENHSDVSHACFGEFGFWSRHVGTQGRPNMGTMHTYSDEKAKFARFVLPPKTRAMWTGIQSATWYMWYIVYFWCVLVRQKNANELCVRGRTLGLTVLLVLQPKMVFPSILYAAKVSCVEIPRTRAHLSRKIGAINEVSVRQHDADLTSDLGTLFMAFDWLDRRPTSETTLPARI